MRASKQQGMATILLVLLIGITVMLITASVARALMTKKEAVTAAHAQTNVQIMGWAGVNAFREYLLNLATTNITDVTDLQGKTISLATPNSNIQELSVFIEKVDGCIDQDSACLVIADVYSKNNASQAGTTIRTIYNLTLTEGIVPVNNLKNTLSFSGNTVFTGLTTIRAEEPNAEVTLNADGNLSLNLGFRTENISELNINATGDVYIDCGLQNCGNAIINVITQGKVTLLTGKNFGNIEALGTVSVHTGAKAQNIRSIGEVTIMSNAEVQNIETMGDVTLSLGKAKNIKANGSVTLNTSSEAENIESNRNVVLWTWSQVKNITAKNEVEIHTTTSAEDIKAGGKVEMTGLGAEARDIESLREVELSHIFFSGAKARDIYANNIILKVATSARHAYAVTTINGDRAETINPNSNVAKEKLIALQQYLASHPTIDESDIRRVIGENTEFTNKVDVTVYKKDANYIFTRNGRFDRVFLNHLKNESSNINYLYENNSQYMVNEEGEKTPINSEGFSIGDYTLNGNTYTGAICLTVVNGKCTTEIIGYLPRISIGKTLGLDDDYDYGRILNRWRVRSILNPSTIDNSTLAPGIMYFEGTLEFAGGLNWRSDSLTNAYTNSFLAEGEIWSIAFSPRIFAPHEVIREGSDKVSLICNRKLKHANNNVDLDISKTTPPTLSNRYLVPTNLCKNDNEFLHNMSINTDNTQKTVTIDGINVPKLDLGNVAFMANGQIHMGACTRIYGDVLTRKGVTTSAGCGFTDHKNQITGSISTQGVDGGLIANHILSGTNLTLASPNNGGDGSGQPNQGVGLKAQSLTTQWAKYL